MGNGTFSNSSNPYKKKVTPPSTYKPPSAATHTAIVNMMGGKTYDQSRQGSVFYPTATGMGNTPQRSAETGNWYLGGATQPLPTFNNQPPPYRPTGGGGKSGGGGGGGGGGAPKIDTGAIMALINGHQPERYQWEDLDLPDYQARDFYNFDTTQYDKARTGITQGLAADQATGNQAYADATTELQQYQNPFANRAYAQNQPVDAAMQRMLQANGGQQDQATTNQGVQADQAFGNVLALMGGAAANNQASSLRALGGDQRRFTESLQNQGRNMNLGVDMRQAAAQEQYNKDKWQYGEEVARLNYQTNMQEVSANNTGRNQTNQQNTQMANDWWSTNGKTLIDLIAGGAAIDPAQLQQFISGGAAPAAPAA